MISCEGWLWQQLEIWDRLLLYISSMYATFCEPWFVSNAGHIFLVVLFFVAFPEKAWSLFAFVTTNVCFAIHHLTAFSSPMPFARKYFVIFIRKCELKGHKKYRNWISRHCIESTFNYCLPFLFSPRGQF